jgi:hypothetical protein
MGITMSRKVPLRKQRAKSKPESEGNAELLGRLSDQEREEFREFCESDELPVTASPQFKERLRERLRKLVKNLYGIWFILLSGTMPYN